MTSSVSVIYLTSLFLWKIAQITSLKSSSSVNQWRGFRSVNVGDKVTLPCFYKGDAAVKVFWYKQDVGQKVVLITTFFKYNVNQTFHGEFKNDPRFMLDKNDLIITDVRVSDSAVYYCFRSFLNNLEFVATTTVAVIESGSNVPALVHQSESGSLHPGGSVTLNCTVHTGICDGQHSVYWFKDSGQTPPGIIYTQGDRNDQCERKPDTQTHTCVYNLPLNSLSPSHVGTYYCAVASCGHILFGNGTKLEFEDEVSTQVLVYCLSGALTVTTILVVILTLLYKTKTVHIAEVQTRISARSTTKSETYQDENLVYAAVSVNLSNRSRTQSNSVPSECVYSSMKQ